MTAKRLPNGRIELDGHTLRLRDQPEGGFVVLDEADAVFGFLRPGPGAELVADADSSQRRAQLRTIAELLATPRGAFPLQ